MRIGICRNLTSIDISATATKVRSSGLFPLANSNGLYFPILIASHRLTAVIVASLLTVWGLHISSNLLTLVVMRTHKLTLLSMLGIPLAVTPRAIEAGGWIVAYLERWKRCCPYRTTQTIWWLRTAVSQPDLLTLCCTVV